MSSISTILLDADGVVQLVPHDWRDRWAALINDRERLDDFLSDIFSVEGRYKIGGNGFEASIEIVLSRWECADRLAEALSLWELIDLQEPVLTLVSQWRSMGYQVGLATNQQPYRCNYMVRTLGLEAHFDALFVSCEMGVAKPSPEFFAWIKTALNEHPESLLFIDDAAGNVEAARKAGLRAELFHIQEGVPTLKRLVQSHGVR